VNLAEWAVRRRISTIMVFLAIALLGAITVYYELSVQLFPDIVYPHLGIYASISESTPQETEEDLTIPIENAVAALPGARKIKSWSGSWGCWFDIDFDFSTDMRFTFIEMNERMDQLRRNFPKGQMNYGVLRVDTNELQNQHFMEVSVSGEGSADMLRDIVLRRIKQRLEEVDGIYKVEVGGDAPREVEVSLDRHLMASYGVDFFTLVQKLQSWSNDRVYLGKIESPGQFAYVRLSEHFGNPDQMADVVVDAERNYKLGDMSEVSEIASSGEALYRVNGRPSIGLHLQKEARANPLKTAARVRKVLEVINERELPEGYAIEITESQARILSEVMTKIAKLAAAGIALAVLVLLVFVRHIKITLIVILAIPLCILGTFNLFYINDITINILSLIGLTLAIGMLLDNGIVVLENIYRNFQLGRSRRESAVRGASEVIRAIFASTMTTVVAFAPIFFIRGEVRLVFREMGLSIVYPLLISLLVAITFVPMATYYVLKYEKAGQISFLTARRKRGIFRRIYLYLLKGSLRHRGRVLTVVALVLFFTWNFQRAQLETGYIDQNVNEESFRVYVTMPEGTVRETTDKTAREVEKIVIDKEKFPGIKRVTTWVFDDQAKLAVRMKDKDERVKTMEQVKSEVLDETEDIPLANIGFRRRRSRQGDGSVGFGEKGRIELRGPDYDVLVKVAARIEQYMLTAIPGIREVNNDLTSGAPEIRLIIDREKSALLKINAKNIQQAVMASNSRGHISSVRLRRGDEELAVVFRLNDAQERILKDLNDIQVWNADGRSFALKEVCDLVPGHSPGRIFRKNQERIASVVYTTDNVRSKKEIIEDLKKLGDYVAIPAGYSYSLEGEQRQINEMLEALATVLFTGFALVYMVMAGLFESLFAPLVIMVTVPLAIIGAIWGLLITDNPYDIMAAMGSIFLMGIVVNNGIVFIDFIGVLRRDHNFSRLRAILTAGQYRMRPIFMTSLTTMLGLLPLALRTGESNPWRPLAVVVIGGMSLSTVLTLIVLPCAYLTLEEFQGLLLKWLRRVFGWRRFLIIWSGKRRRRIRQDFVQQYPKRAITAQQLRELPLSLSAHNLTVMYRNRRAEWGAMLRGMFTFKKGITVEGIAVPVPQAPVEVQCGFFALSQVDFQLEPGMVGLLGPNGAGKTTLLRLLSLLTVPGMGSVEICGLDARQHRSELARLIGYLPQSFGFPGDFRVQQYLRQQAILRGIADPAVREASVQRALETVNLWDRKNERVRHLSGGMRQRLGIAQTLLHLPRIIIVDEPTAGLDPMERMQFRNLLAGLAVERIVILSTHIVEDIGDSCEKLLLLDHGKLIYAGTQKALIERVEGNVWEWVQPEEAALPTGITEVQQTFTAAGRKVRAVAPGAPVPGAVVVKPNLQDAYFAYRKKH
jgi:hydrophobic/amphiphilic exporter-1 (mainly G- bacteria), HAE1 family